MHEYIKSLYPNNRIEFINIRLCYSILGLIDQYSVAENNIGQQPPPPPQMNITSKRCMLHFKLY